MRLLQRFSLLRRIANAQERQAIALERIASYLEPPKMQQRTHIKPAEVDTLDVDWLNKHHDEVMTAQEHGYELEDEA